MHTVAVVERREIDDDIIAFAGALLIELRQPKRADHEISVVGDEMEGNAGAGGTGSE